MTAWRARTAYGIDFETTGVDVHHDRAVTCTIVRVDAGTLRNHRTWLINPGVEIPEGATAVHGITTERARTDGVDPAAAIAEIGTMVLSVLKASYPLVAFNAPFDLSLLEAELHRHGHETVTARTVPSDWHTVIDPMVLGRGLDTVNRGFRKGRKYKLPDLCERYNVPFTESHDATADATGATLLALAMLDSEPYFDAHDPKALFTAQQTWRREDQHRFREWVKREGRQAEYSDIDGGWPLHSRLLQEVPA